MQAPGIAVFGGTFDPIHQGHLQILTELNECAFIKEIIVVPNAIPPHKSSTAAPEHRLKMLSLSLETISITQKKTHVSKIEILRDGPSFMSETLQQLHHENPGECLYLVMGSDSFFTLHLWKNPDQILSFATPLIVRRDAQPPDLFQSYMETHFSKNSSFQSLTNELIPISSVELRAAIKQGNDVSKWIPDSVLRYIQEEGLYL